MVELLKYFFDDGEKVAFDLFLFSEYGLFYFFWSSIAIISQLGP